jgi:hypothetical protein
MRRFIAGTIAVALLGAAAGCGSSGSPSSPPKPAAGGTTQVKVGVIPR